MHVRLRMHVQVWQAAAQHATAAEAASRAASSLAAAGAGAGNSKQQGMTGDTGARVWVRLFDFVSSKQQGMTGDTGARVLTRRSLLPSSC